MVYLAGDIGGTKTHLALFERRGARLEKLREAKFPSQYYPDLQSIAREFLKGSDTPIEKGCFGIAGPVRGRTSQATNLPWLVDAGAFERVLNVPHISLINDLEANAWGLNLVGEGELHMLNSGDKGAVGNRAMISAGTGLGEAGLFFDGSRHIPFACEGGHVDFAPRNSIEDELLIYLRKKFGHVSYERILSGPGLCNLYRFVVETKKKGEDPQVWQEIMEGDSPLLISEKGVHALSEACAYTLDLFVSIYGSEAGNTALKMLAVGGVYLGGGIVPNILRHFTKENFNTSFTQKGRFTALLENISIYVVLNPQTALLGAAYYADRHMETRY